MGRHPAVLLLMLLMMSSVAGCIGGDSTPSDGTPTNESTQTEVNSSMDMLNSTIGNLTHELQQATLLVQSLEANAEDVEQLTATLVIANSTIQNLTQELQQATLLVQSLEANAEDVEQLAAALAVANNTVSNLTTQVQLHANASDALRAEIEQLEFRLEQANATVSELQRLLTSTSEISAGMYYPVRFETYNSTGPYMNHARWNEAYPLEVDRNVWERVTFDEHGVPTVNYSWGVEYVPTTAFHWGLLSYSQWIESGNVSNFENATNIAEWAVSNQSEEGAWLWWFPYNFSGGIVGSLEAGWPSAMTQGLGMSFMARMYSATNDSRYLNATLRALQPFNLTVDEGGVTRLFNGAGDWYELYPTPTNGSFVLNGFMYGLLGLYDVSQITGSNASQRLYDDGLVTLRQTISMFDLGCNTSYDLVHLSVPTSAPNVARDALHNLHISLLSVFNANENEMLLSVEERWFRYAMGDCFASPNGANR